MFKSTSQNMQHRGRRREVAEAMAQGAPELSDVDRLAAVRRALVQLDHQIPRTKSGTPERKALAARKTELIAECVTLKEKTRGERKSFGKLVTLPQAIMQAARELLPKWQYKQVLDHAHEILRNEESQAPQSPASKDGDAQ